MAPTGHSRLLPRVTRGRPLVQGEHQAPPNPPHPALSLMSTEPRSRKSDFMAELFLCFLKCFKLVLSVIAP